MTNSSETNHLIARLMAAFDLPGLRIPLAYVRLFVQGETIPEEVAAHGDLEESVMSCQATRHAAAGNPVLLTRDNIGCVAAAISLGLVDADQTKPLEGRRTYTCIMKDQSEFGEDFVPPAPADFTSGEVYACAEAGRPEYGLFGAEDSGRFQDRATARKAIAEMVAIQPARVAGAFFFDNQWAELALEPDVILLAVRPVELTRLIQGWAFLTGQRLNASMGPVRVVNSDLIARPYLSQEINISTYCLGARLVAGFEADRMGMGIPRARLATLVEGMERSRTGYPFPKYPGAKA